MNIKKNILVFMLAAGVAFSAAAGTRDSSKSWKDTASEMKVIIDDAYSLYINGNADAGYERVNDAYFGHYEVDGFERNTQSRIGGSRAAGLVFTFTPQAFPFSSITSVTSLLNLISAPAFFAAS